MAHRMFKTKPREHGIDPMLEEGPPSKKRRVRPLRRGIRELGMPLSRPLASAAGPSTSDQSTQPLSTASWGASTPILRTTGKRGASNKNLESTLSLTKKKTLADIRVPSTSVGPVQQHRVLLSHDKDRRLPASTIEELWKTLPEAKLVGVRISLMSEEDVRREGGNREITSHSYGDKSKTDTIYDTRLGPSSLTVKCDTCSMYGCVGHFGVIDMNRKVFCPLQIKNLVLVLSCICGSCGSLLMTNKEIRSKKLDILLCFSKIKAMSIICVNRHCQTGDQCDSNPTYTVKEYKSTGEIACVSNGTVYSMTSGRS